MITQEKRRVNDYIAYIEETQRYSRETIAIAKALQNYGFLYSPSRGPTIPKRPKLVNGRGRKIQEEIYELTALRNKKADELDRIGRLLVQKRYELNRQFEGGGL